VDDVEAAERACSAVPLPVKVLDDEFESASHQGMDCTSIDSFPSLCFETFFVFYIVSFIESFLSISGIHQKDARSSYVLHRMAVKSFICPLRLSEVMRVFNYV
jgi:hypothetical protein